MIHVEFCYPPNSSYPTEIKEKLADIRIKNRVFNKVYVFNCASSLVCFELDKRFPGNEEFCQAVIIVTLFKRPEKIWADKWVTFEEFMDILESQIDA